MRVRLGSPAPFLACLVLALLPLAVRAAAKDKCQGTKQERKQKLPPRSMSEAQLESVVTDYRAAVAAELDGVRKAVLERMELEQGKHLASGAPFDYDVLILSGGGAKGAFGAGFLEGWGTVPEGPDARPEFDMVTGVSTGALIAPFAFIGTDESYRAISDLYLDPQPNWARKRGLLPFLPKNSSLFNNCHLRDAIYAAIDPSVAKDVAAAAATHRVLLIGATNLDTGSGRAFDLGHVAQGGDPEAVREPMVSRLLASSAIPAAFAPVLIDGMLYADGGATTNLFIVTFPGPDGPIAQLQARRPGSPLPKIRVWVLVNQKLSPRQKAVQPRWLDVSGQSLETLTSTSQRFALSMLRDMAENARKERGVDVEIRLVSIPETAPEQQTKDMFDKAYMTSLGDLGRAMGANPSSWETELDAPFAVEAEAKP